jgi:RNase P subunit RPR2
MKPPLEALQDQRGAEFDRLRCPSCDAPLAKLRRAEITVPIDWGPPGFDPDAWDTSREPEDEEITATIGHVVELEPGFVNRAIRHPTGPIWYYRPPGRVPQKSTGRVKLPVVVTCKCGAEVRLALSLPEDARFYATADAHQREGLAQEEREDEAAMDAGYQLAPRLSELVARRVRDIKARENLDS